jgi:hypothetical protein
MVPIYAFLEGDTLGVLVLVDESATIAELADKVRQAARVRVAAAAGLRVVHNGHILNNAHNLSKAGIEALDRVEVRLDRTLPDNSEYM